MKEIMKRVMRRAALILDGFRAVSAELELFKPINLGC